MPLRVCQTLLPSSYLDQAGIVIIAKSTSNIKLIATAASDYNNYKVYNLWSQGTVLLLPQKIDKEDDDKVVIGSDQATEQ